MKPVRRFAGLPAGLCNCLLVAMAVFAIGVPGPALAQQARDGEIFDDWGVRCIADPNNAAAQFCTAQHAAINNQNQKTVMAINVGYPPDGSPPRAVIMVPLVVLLEPGLQVQIDGKEPMTFPYEICKPNGCEVHLVLDQQLYSAFSTGVGGKVTVLVPPGKPLAVPFSLKGFTAAVNSLN